MISKKAIKYTTNEKIEYLIVLKKKINELGLGVYNTEMNLLSKIMNNYIKDNEEFYGGIPLPGSNRIMDIIFKNSKKHKISITLRYSQST